MSALKQPREILTAAEYLRSERMAEQKSDYVNGQVYAMAGATANHNRVAGNAYHALRTQLAKRPCEVFNSDMKVRIDKANVFRYPDLSGLCGPILFHDETEDAYTNPAIIIEVLSPSTAKADRGEKFNLYRLLDSLVEYVLVDPERYRVEVFRRDSKNRWSSVIYTEAVDRFHLRSLDVAVELSEIYERVVFAAE